MINSRLLAFATFVLYAAVLANGVERFKTEREKFNYYKEHPEEVEVALAKGAVKASKIADEVLLRVRRKLGL